MDFHRAFADRRFIPEVCTDYSVLSHVSRVEIGYRMSEELRIWSAGAAAVTGLFHAARTGVFIVRDESVSVGYQIEM